MLEDGFEAVIGASGTVLAVADGAEGELEVVANDEDILGCEFVKPGKSGDGEAGIVVESLRFDENGVTILAPESVKFGLLPVELVEFGIEIERQKAVIMARKIVF